VDEYRKVYKVSTMCRVLKVSRSGYYAWRNRLTSTRRRANADLLRRIRQIHVQSRSLYGSPRITAEPNEHGVMCGRHRVARLMKNESIHGEVKRRRFRRTTDSSHSYPLATNLLIERKQTEGVWASDITYVPTSEGWLYVAAVMNVRTRKIIGLSMSDKIS